jgi:hypothetical protein
MKYFAKVGANNLVVQNYKKPQTLVISIHRSGNKTKLF